MDNFSFSFLTGLNPSLLIEESLHLCDGSFQYKNSQKMYVLGQFDANKKMK